MLQMDLIHKNVRYSIFINMILVVRTESIKCSYSVTEDGRSVCGICNKVFNKPSQLRLHINIHYFERPFRCESCAVSFRTKGHLTKHERSVSHHNKVNDKSTLYLHKVMLRHLTYGYIL